MTQYQVIIPSLSLIDENEEVINNNSEKIVCLNKDTVFLEDNTAYQEKSDYVWKLNDSLLSEVTSKLSLKELFISTTDEENIITVYKNVTGCSFPIGPLVIKVLVDDNCITNTITLEDNDQFSVYPNPFSSSIILTNIPTEVEKIEVIDVLGNVVESVEKSTSSIELGEELSTGTYFVHLYSTDGVQVEKVMKVN
jgi:hypothetical protein